MMDRRDLLKFFGAGAIIAPMVDGKVMREAEALIVEPPKVEIVKELPRQMSPQGLVNAFVNRDLLDIHVDFYNRRTREHWQMKAHTFIDATNFQAERTRLYSQGTSLELPASADGVINWVMKGRFI